MTCEDVALELSGPEPSAEARAHVAGCASCQETARVLGRAALPPLTETERLLLQGLASSTQAAWRARQGRGERVRRVASLALAAGVGALLASAVLARRPVEAPREVETVYLAIPELASFDDDAANFSDDEVFLEVGWPSPTEGDL
jgi:hypothetical protein